MNPVTSLPSAIASITLSVSLTLGSTVALAAPPAKTAPASEEVAPTSEEAAPDAVETGASAERKSEAEQLSEQAIAEFSTKNYDGAVELFEQAYEIDPQPNYLFNIGRVYEEAGKLEQAVEYYSQFVKQPGVDIDSREVAFERLRVLQAIVEEIKEPEPEPKQESKDEPKDPGNEADEVAPASNPVDTESARKRKVMRGAGFGLLGVGAGALIGAAVLGSLAQGDRDKAFDREQADSLAARRDLLGSAQNKALTADVLYGVGGALLLTGLVLVIVGYSKPKTQRVALTPSFGPQVGGWGGGMDLRFRF